MAWLLPGLFPLFGSDDVAALEDIWPRYPTQEQEVKKRNPLVGSINAIVIVGRPDRMVSDSELLVTQGIVIKGVDIPGKESHFIDQLKPYLGRPLDMDTIGEIKDTINAYFRSQGHPLILVQVPEQDVTSGVLQIMALESRLGQVFVQDNKYFSSEKLAKMIRVKPGEYIDEGVLVRNLNLINRNPFRHANILYAPGLEEGTTDLILSVEDRRPLRLYTGYENTGVHATGHNRFYAGLNWGNVFGLGDIFAYQYTASDNFSTFQAHTAQYIAPFSWGHVLNLMAGYSSVDVVLDEFLVGQDDGTLQTQQMRNNGFALQGSLRYIMPLYLTRYLLNDLIIGFDFKRTNNTVIFGLDIAPDFGQNVNLTQLVLGYAGDYDRTNFRLDFETNLYWSPGKWISDQTDADYESLVPKAKNKWLYWRSAFAYLQRLPKSFSYFLKLEGQLSTANLLPSEDLSLGGWDTVRGYEQSVVNKENVILASTEFRSPPLPIISKGGRRPADGFQVLAFLDYGYARNQFAYPKVGNKTVDPQSLWLMGIGPGFRYTIDPYFAARVDWGFKLHKDRYIGTRPYFVHFNVTASY
ncbi:MAG: ShlB/FhaC/HecB family hemolysin secretion/activation protein [Chlamydiia bacterium]|nr:ShlB/FhaC/HecB family hemolysin secretion/activation protein [Chlamydiia bacterium]